MYTILAKRAESNIMLFKEAATDTQFNQMVKAIEGFDIDLKGCGYYAIQAKLKLEEISNLTLPEFKTICQLFKY